jgi:CBS domain-containing protein
MLVSDVIGGTSRNVVTVQPGDTIADAVHILKEFGIGAVVVSGDGRSVDGNMSERDVVRHLANEQDGTLRLKVEDLMTQKVSTCRLTDKLETIMSPMTTGKFRHMPILHENGAVAAEHREFYGGLMTAEAAFARLIDAIVAGDPAAVTAAYHPDDRIWHNFDQIEQTVDENVATLKWFIRAMPERRRRRTPGSPLRPGQRRWIDHPHRRIRGQRASGDLVPTLRSTVQAQHEKPRHRTHIHGSCRVRS